MCPAGLNWQGRDGFRRSEVRQVDAASNYISAMPQAAAKMLVNESLIRVVGCKLARYEGVYQSDGSRGAS